ncbi:hypothetical protein ACFY2M_10270 [Streptomyces sp. NPDC001276]|uniref:hypothetical protein n=1 Tax=Streptomyces sp. NPDC001276 TaxID=3364555 RepID=UPI0036AC9CDB
MPAVHFPVLGCGAEPQRLPDLWPGVLWRSTGCADDPEAFHRTEVCGVYTQFAVYCTVADLGSRAGFTLG